MASLNGKHDPAKELASLQQEEQLLLARMRVRRLKESRQERRTVLTQRKRLQEQNEAWEYLSGYADLLDRFRDSARDLLHPLSIANDRRYGANWPFWRSWQEHSRLRAASRLLATMDSTADGMLNGLQGYVISTGYTFRATSKEAKHRRHNRELDPLLEAVQDVIDLHGEANAPPGVPGGVNGLPYKEREAFRRSRRDGEYFEEFCAQKDGLTLRHFVEPEHILQRPGATLEECSFGIEVDPDNLLERWGYWKCLDGISANGEMVDAEDMIHFRANVDTVIKRGLPDFCFDTYDQVRVASRLIGALGTGSALQASIAYALQHDAAGPEQVDDFLSENQTYTERELFTGKVRGVQKHYPGMIPNMDKGTNFVASPYNQGVAGHVSVVDAVLRAAGRRWQAPEWLVSGNGQGQNFATAVVSESPMVKVCEGRQQEYGDHFKAGLWIALRNWCQVRGGIKDRSGKTWSWKEVRRLVEIQAEAPSLVVRNQQAESQQNKTYSEMGLKSPQTITQELGLDYEQEQENIKEHKRKYPPEEEQGGGGPGEGEPPGPQDQGGEEAEADPLQQVLGEEGGEAGQRQALGEALLEGGFSGEKKDKRGRRMCYDDGKRVPCGKKDGGGKGKGGDAPLTDEGREAVKEVMQELNLDPGGKGWSDDPKQRERLADALEMRSSALPGEQGAQLKQLSQRIRQAAAAKGGEAKPAPREQPVPKSKPAAPKEVAGLKRPSGVRFADRGGKPPAQVVGPVLGQVDAGTLAAAANAPDGTQVELRPGGTHPLTGEPMSPEQAFRSKFELPDGTTADRTFYKDDQGNLVVHNDYFQIGEDSPLKGQGAAIFANQTKALKAMGVKRIETHAAGEPGTDLNGYYTWPRMGYDGTIQDRHFDALPDNLKQQMGESRSILDLYELPGGKEAWKEHGGDILDASFDLSDNSRSQKVLNAYLSERAGRAAGAKAKAAGSPAQ